VPTSQVLFGTDYTPEPIETTLRELPNSPYSQDELQQIERANAEKLFPRFKL
jgi:predicted TIM-barrel fold metal-dependent hydrolase